MNITKTQFSRMTISQVKAQLAKSEISLNMRAKQYAKITGLTQGDVQPTPGSSSPKLYKNPEAQILKYVQHHPQLKAIADQPCGIWLGEWSGDVWSTVRGHVTQAGDTLPVFILYNIPGRDNGNYSAGGLKSPDEYYAWVGKIADAIGNSQAIVVIEPDAVGLSREIPQDKKTERLSMVHGAVKALKAKSNVQVFIDASMWVPVDENVQLLKQAGLDMADGFSENVSGFKALVTCLSYGNELAQKTGKKFVIDTSRNGNGPWETHEADAWCNPPGRKIGKVPTFETDSPRCYAYLWLKAAGESDGTCRGGPRAGEFWVEYAVGLVT